MDGEIELGVHGGSTAAGYFRIGGLNLGDDTQ